MDRLPLADAECAAQLGMTRDELLAARAAIAPKLLECGTVLADAQAEAQRLVDDAREPLMRAAYEAWRLGLGYDLIAQCTADVRLTPEGRRLRTKPVRGVVTHSTISRWVGEMAEREEQPQAS